MLFITLTAEYIERVSRLTTSLFDRWWYMARGGERNAEEMRWKLSGGGGGGVFVVSAERG